MIPTEARHDVPSEVEPGSFAQLAADCDAVRMNLLALHPDLATVPRQRMVRIPERALGVVAGLGDYGD